MRKKCFWCLLFLLLIFGIHSIGYSQNDPAETNSSPPQLDTTQIRAEILSSVLYIRVPQKDGRVSEGSGVLGDKDHKFAVTNAHVTEGHNKVEVYFPAYDSGGELISERDFYKPNSFLRRLGYYTEGRVVAENAATDVAVIVLEGLPKTAKEIKSDENYDYSRLEKGTPVYIMGNPGNRSDLWQLDLGVFEEYQEKEEFGLVISANVYPGNSGGPVVDREGALIGLISQGSMQTKSTDVVPIKHIYDLAKKLEYRNTFSIQNGIESTILYEIQWSENGDWKGYSLEPDDKPFSHTDKSTQKPIQGYPKIRFTKIDMPLSSLHQTYKLNTTSEIFSESYEEKFVKEGGYDDYQYRFGHDSEKNKIHLQESRKAAWIANYTEDRVPYKIKWTPDESTRWKTYLLEPGKAYPHWWVGSPEKILDGYPKIRISKVYKERNFDTKNDTWIDTELAYNRMQTLKVETEFFNIDTTEQDNIIDAPKPGAVKSENNYHHIAPSPSAFVPADFQYGVPKPVLMTEEESPTPVTFFGVSIVWWFFFAIMLALGIVLGVVLDDKISLWFRRLRNRSL